MLLWSIFTLDYRSFQRPIFSDKIATKATQKQTNEPRRRLEVVRNVKQNIKCFHWVIGLYYLRPIIYRVIETSQCLVVIFNSPAS